jgi:hypothetical protein
MPTNRRFPPRGAVVIVIVRVVGDGDVNGNMTRPPSRSTTRSISREELLRDPFEDTP